MSRVEKILERYYNPGKDLDDEEPIDWIQCRVNQIADLIAAASADICEAIREGKTQPVNAEGEYETIAEAVQVIFNVEAERDAEHQLRDQRKWFEPVLFRAADQRQLA